MRAKLMSICAQLLRVRGPLPCLGVPLPSFGVQLPKQNCLFCRGSWPHKGLNRLRMRGKAVLAVRSQERELVFALLGINLAPWQYRPQFCQVLLRHFRSDEVEHSQVLQSDERGHVAHPRLVVEEVWQHGEPSPAGADEASRPSSARSDPPPEDCLIADSPPAWDVGQINGFPARRGRSSASCSRRVRCPTKRAATRASCRGRGR